METVQDYLDRAFELFEAYIGNEGTLDYPDKEYGWLSDEIEDVQVGYFKEGYDVVDSDYAERLREKNFTMTEEQAIATLSHRIDSITEYLNRNE